MKICKFCNENEVKYNNGKCKPCNNEYQKKYRKTSEWAKQNDAKWKERYDKMRADPVKKEKYKTGRAEYMRERKKNDPQFLLEHNTRSHISVCISLGYFNSKSECALGCNYETYKQHLESLFTNEMNWENYGDYWEIDHILPLSKGGSFHYTNTQPLTVLENRKKGNKL